MSPLYTYNNILLAVNGALAAGQDCCCDQPPPTEPPPTLTPSPSNGGEGCPAASPYPPEDPCYQQVIAQDPFCCFNEWDQVCQNAYDACNGG